MIPMDRDYIDRHDVTHRYVHGGLSAEEMAEFEVFLMDHPDVLEQVQLEQVMRTGLRTQQQEKPSAFSGRLGKWMWSWPTAVATTFVVFMASYLALSPKELAPNMPVMYVHEYRSANLENLNAVVLDEIHHSHVLLVLQPGNMQASQFQLSIISEVSGAPLITQQNVSISPTGDITVPVAVNNITRGRYQVVLVPIGSDQAAEEFVINVM